MAKWTSTRIFFCPSRLVWVGVSTIQGEAQCHDVYIDRNVYLFWNHNLSSVSPKLQRVELSSFFQDILIFSSLFHHCRCLKKWGVLHPHFAEVVRKSLIIRKSLEFLDEACKQALGFTARLMTWVLVRLWHWRYKKHEFYEAYPLVMSKWLLKMAINSWFSHKKWWFSIATSMLVYQRLTECFFLPWILMGDFLIFSGKITLVVCHGENRLVEY